MTLRKAIGFKSQSGPTDLALFGKFTRAPAAWRASRWQTAGGHRLFELWAAATIRMAADNRRHSGGGQILVSGPLIHSADQGPGGGAAASVKRSGLNGETAGLTPMPSNGDPGGAAAARAAACISPAISIKNLGRAMVSFPPNGGSAAGSMNRWFTARRRPKAVGPHRKFFGDRIGTSPDNWPALRWRRNLPGQRPATMYCNDNHPGHHPRC